VFVCLPTKLEAVVTKYNSATRQVSEGRKLYTDEVSLFSFFFINAPRSAATQTPQWMAIKCIPKVRL